MSGQRRRYVLVYSSQSEIKEVVHLAEVIALSSHLSHQIPSTADILLLLLCVGVLLQNVSWCWGIIFLDISIEKKKQIHFVQKNLWYRHCNGYNVTTIFQISLLGVECSILLPDDNKQYVALTLFLLCLIIPKHSLLPVANLQPVLGYSCCVSGLHRLLSGIAEPSGMNCSTATSKPLLKYGFLFIYLGVMKNYSRNTVGSC